MSSRKRVYVPYEGPRPAGSSLLRHRAIHPPPSDPLEQAADMATCEMLMRFMACQGIPSDDVTHPVFETFMRFMDSRKAVPTQKQIELGAEKVCGWNRPLVNYSKAVGPLSVTIDFVGDKDDKYMAFSIHFFEDSHQRKNVVYLRKMMLSEIDAESVMITIRRAVNSFSYGSVKFTNILTTDKKTCQLLHRPDITKRHYVCFYHYVTQFVDEILKIPDFANGLNRLREFVRHIRRNSDLYSKYRRMQLSRNAELDLPAIDKRGSWHSTTVFLTKCLILHDTFTEFCQRWNLTTYISSTNFYELLQLQRILQQCVTHSKQLSVGMNSISQVIPAIMSMRNYISGNSHGYQFERQIRESFTKAFAEPTSGVHSQRYDIATLLDPRHSYREAIYSNSIWQSIERKLVEEFASTIVQTSERSFSADIMDMTREERYELIVLELQAYRNLCLLERPEANDSPFNWWASRTRVLENLSILAREYLACPAIAIDAVHFFGPGGKLRYMCDTMDQRCLEDCLVVAGRNQEFRGRGTKVDHIEPMVIARLNATAVRRHEMERFCPLVSPNAPVLKEVKEELREVKMEPEDPSDQPVYRPVTMTAPIPSPDPEPGRRTQFRRCALCRMYEEQPSVKNVTIDTEKLFLAFGAVLGGEKSVPEARDVFSKSAKSYYCRRHFSETCDEVLAHLNVADVVGIVAAPDEAFGKMLDILGRIRGRAMDLNNVKYLILMFVEKYSYAADEDSSDPAFFPNSPDDSEQIPPKSERVPRKQVLENVTQHDTTVKLIQEEPFKLPPPNRLKTRPNPEDQAMCCFCLGVNERQSMLRMPKTRERLVKWNERFGEEFFERLDPSAENYICKQHFLKTSFSTRGRLLRGMMPPADSEKVEVTYRVHGDGFLKVAESKIGTDRAASVDLADEVDYYS